MYWYIFTCTILAHTFIGVLVDWKTGTTYFSMILQRMNKLDCQFRQSPFHGTAISVVWGGRKSRGHPEICQIFKFKLYLFNSDWNTKLPQRIKSLSFSLSGLHWSISVVLLRRKKPEYTEKKTRLSDLVNTNHLMRQRRGSNSGQEVKIVRHFFSSNTSNIWWNSFQKMF